MGHRAKENKRFMNSPPPRYEVQAFIKNYHAEVIAPEIEQASMSALRIMLTLLVETGVVERDKLDEFMKKAAEIADMEKKMKGDSESKSE